MHARPIRLLAVTALVAGTLIAITAAASAAPGPGTFTKITTPSHDTIFKFNGNVPPQSNTFAVAGTASNDVTSVDVDCLLVSTSGVVVFQFATAVPVASGSFSTTAAFPQITGNCRLRAIPTGVDPETDYVGSFAGPILYLNMMAVEKDGATPFGFAAIGEQGTGIGEAEDASECGVVVLATVETPGMEVRGLGNEGGCAFWLPPANLGSSGTPTASSITVDGHNAYLPQAVYSFLRNGQALTLPQPALTTTFKRYSNGDIRVTASGPLKRCSVDDTYPPTSGSCPNLVGTGVVFRRVIDIFRGAHQIRIRDSFGSTNGVHHNVHAQYRAALPAPDFGATGYAFPGHGSTFHQAHPDQVVSGLGTRANTLYIRSDIYAGSDDPRADTLGYTWSRAPARIQFSHGSTNLFAMPYSLSVPAHGKAYLGFADSEAPLTATAKKRAAVAVAEMVSAPRIASPSNGGTINGRTTTVKGTVSIGANGLPTSVVVNGHSAHLTKLSATKLAYSVTFSESFGQHTITVTAKDSAGNRKSRSIRITNG